MPTIHPTAAVVSPFELFAELSPEALLYAFISFAAAMFILMKIRPMMILGVVYLYVILVHMYYFGPHPMHFILAALTAAFVRIGADGVVAAKNAPPQTQMMMVRIASTLIRALVNRRGRQGDGNGNNGGQPPENI